MKSPWPSSSRQVPLRLLLLLPFVLQIFVAVGLTSYFSLTNGRKALDSLASKLQAETTARVAQHLDSYLAIPAKVNQINADAIQLGLLDLRDFHQVGHYFWKQMRQFNLGYISYGSQKGEFIGVERLDTGELLINERSARTRNKLAVYRTNSQGDRTQLQAIKADYDPRTESWYGYTVKAQKQLWSSIYSWEDKPEVMSFSVNQPIVDAKGKLVGVMGIDLVLTQIQTFLKRMNIKSTGRIFILERNGLLVASSANEPPYRLVNGQGTRLAAVDSPDRQIHDTAQALNQQFRNLQTIQTVQTLTLMSNGQKELVRVTPWRDEFGLDWLIVVAVPETDFLAEIDLNTRSTILLCLVALVIAIVVGFCTSQWIAYPIRRLSQAAQVLATASQEHQSWSSWQPTAMTTHCAEINVLAASFNTMAEQLQHSFAALAATNQGLEQHVAERTQELTTALKYLKQMQAHLVHTEKMSGLGQMIAGIAHEVNNPIGFIHNNLNYANQYLTALLQLLSLYQTYYPEPVAAIQQELEDFDLDFVQQDLPKLLASMGQGTTRIRDIVLSLRNFSRLDEAAMKLVNLHEGIDSTLLMVQHRLRPTARSGPIQISQHYGPLPLVECYAGQLNQVFLHLLENAIDAIIARPVASSPPGQITITTQMAGTDWVAITIADNGVGMTEAVQAKIFDPFFTTKPIGQGTGLGLSVSYQVVVEQHGGALTCLSDLGQGTQFQLTLPVSQPEQVIKSGLLKPVIAV